MPVPALLRYLHPGATAAAGLEWAALMGTPVGSVLRRQVEGSSLEPYLAAARSLLVSSPGLPSQGGGRYKFVGAIQGRIDQEELREASLYREPGTAAELLIMERWIVALIDEETILLGDLESVKAVLASEPAPPPIAERAAKIAPHCHAWLLAASPPGSFLHGGHAWSEALAGVEGMEAAAALAPDGGLIAEIHLSMAGSEPAARLAAGLAGTLSLARADDAGAGWTEVLERVAVFADGAKVRIEGQLSAGELERVAARMGGEDSLALTLPGTQAVPCRRLVDDMAATLGR